MYKKAILSTLIIWFLLASIIPNKHPLPKGDATIFWEMACGVELAEFNGYFPYIKEVGIFSNQSDEYFYYYKEHHGLHLFTINKTSLNLTIDQVFILLDKGITTSKQYLNQHNNLQDKNRRRLNCQKIRDETNSDMNTFFSSLIKTNHEQRYMNFFNRQRQRAQMYWAVIMFETIFLPLWWLFTFHPGTLGQWHKKFSTRLAFSPLILFTPLFIGYAKDFQILHFTTEGILYPIYLFLFSIPFSWLPLNAFDAVILSAHNRYFYSGISPTLVLIHISLVMVISLVIKKIKTT